MNYKDLRVWQNSLLIVNQIYELTKSLPKNELYGLASQLRRAAISIPSNITEGYHRANTKEYIQFLNISLGSLAELETLLIITTRQYPIQTKKALEPLTKEKRMLIALIKRLRQP